MSRYLIDCDPGHDDALALLMAARHLALIGVTTVFGNAVVENTTRNALAVVEAAGLDLPVSKGAGSPLSGGAWTGETIHGSSGLDGADFPPPLGSAVDLPAADFIIETSKRHDDLVIIAVAPLTNIATALELDAGLASRIERISIMGGSTSFGNATPAAEFNIFADPEAAERVFRAGIPLAMAGLDATTTFGLRRDDIHRLRQTGGRVANALAGALDFYLARQSAMYDRDYAPVHDVCAVLPFTHPHLVSHMPMHVAVECHGELTRGMTVCDRRGIKPGAGLVPAVAPNAEVLTHIHGNEVIKAVLDTLAEFP